MASKIDLSLNELIQMKRKKRGGRVQGFAGRGRGGGGRGGQFTPRGRGGGGRGRGFRGRGGGRGGSLWQVEGEFSTPVGGASVTPDTKDLRDVLAKKQKTTVSDLRAKLPPKGSTGKSPMEGSSRGHGFTARGGASSGRGRGFHTSPLISRSRTQGGDTVQRSSRRSDPGPGRSSTHRRKDSPINLPSYSEAKKITVTVPGLSQPMSSESYRREERLAAAILRSRDSRQESFSRGREEFLASTITSAFGGAAPSSSAPLERERGSLHSTGYSRIRGTSRSPSPLQDLSYKLPHSHYSSVRPVLPKPKGITTMTAMVISNLSDTVSENDVAELCNAVGPVEGINMLAPGMAEVVFRFKDDALEAFKKYNQRNLDGQPMMCRIQPASRSRLATGGYGTSMMGDGFSGADDYFHSSSHGFYPR